MSNEFLLTLFVFTLAVFLGVELIFKVPSMLHTPLMSGTNAIHGIILLGGLLVLARAQHWYEYTGGFMGSAPGCAA